MKPAAYSGRRFVSIEPAGGASASFGQGTFSGATRYVRLYGQFARACLLRELMFRANFLVRLVTHVLWLSLMLVFLKVIFLHTRRIGDWDQNRLLFFVRTYLTLNATVNCLFMSGCGRLSELVRNGSLDFELLKPVDEQFLLTCQRIDWALFPQILLGLAIAAFASVEAGIALSPWRVLTYFALLLCGVAILYSLLVALTATSVWTVRHEELYELWFYLLQFGNYPEDVYRGNANNPVHSPSRVVPNLVAAGTARYIALDSQD